MPAGLHTSTLCSVLLAAGAALRSASAMRMQITPVQQVLQALAEMKAKAESSMEAEQKTYATYKEWVDDNAKQLGFEIQTGESTIEKLIAFIDKANNKVAVLGNEIGDLDADIARMEGEKKDATAIRTTEHEEYVKLQTDYAESVDALQRAIQVLSAQAYDRPQAEALLQQMAKTTPGMTRVLAAFLQEKVQGDGAPAVAAYDFQSDGIIKLLEQLFEKFKGELDDVEKDESNRAHYYGLEMIHLKDSIAKASADRDAKAAIKAETAAASAKAVGDLGAAKKELAADKAFLAEITATFKAKTDAYVENQQVRKDELEALKKATEVISSPEVSASYAEHVNLAQVPSASPGFLQLRSTTRRLAARQRAAELLRRRAGALSSKALAALAGQVAENPFAKVISLIEGLLARLKEEAAAEAEHKAWCDEQLKKNKLKRNKRTSAVEELTAKIEELTGDIADMGKTVDILVKEQADLAKSMSEATAQREQEKATNLDTIADAKAGTEAVKKALVILREFYSSQAGALLQTGGRQVPEMEAYKGLQGSSKGVIGMLEVIQTDFMRLESETKAAEQEAASEYDSAMGTAKADKLEKHNREVKLRLEKDQDEFEKSQLQKDLAANEDELEKANTYYEYLKPNCVEIHVNYEERAARRKEEIAALREAYSILDTKGDSA